MRLYIIILVFIISLSAYFRLPALLLSGGPPPKTLSTSDPDFKYEYGVAMEYFSYEEYNTALPIFQKLLKYDPENCNINFYVGVCFLNSSADRLKAIPYLEKATKKTSITYSNKPTETNAPVFAFLHLGQAYHLNYQFNEAIKAYKRFQNFFSARTRDEEYLNLVKRHIEIAEHAKELITKKPLNVKINPITLCNTTYDEYNPAITPDGKELYFCSRRKGNLGGTMIIDGGYAEDIYNSIPLNDVWQKAKAIRSTRMNTMYPDIMGGISSDYGYLFLSAVNGKHLDIFVCKQVGKKGKKKWSNPENIGTPVNSNENEYYATLSPDGQTLYFVAEKKEGLGGKDIYSSERINETKWAKPINLGPKINTPYNEDTPFMAADGATFYFSSEGHNSMGGFDIFMSTLQNGEFSDPENIGIPINTTSNDTGYKINADGTKAYYSTAKDKKFGETDLFEIILQPKN